MPKISIIIPTYNRADMLVRAVESVLAQTYQDFEIIVVDDGSTDHTREALQQFGEQVRYLYQENSGLPAVARNAGIKIARGEYLAFLDSDDCWLPDKLQTQLAVLETHATVGLVCANAYQINRRGQRSGRLYHAPGLGKSGPVFLDLLEENFVITSTVMLRREALAMAGAFPETKKLRVGEDYTLWLRVALDWEVKYLAQPLTEYRDVPAAGVRGEQDNVAYFTGMTHLLRSFSHVSMNRRYRRALNLRLGVQRKHLITALWNERRYKETARQLAALLAEQPVFVFRWIIFDTRQWIKRLWH